MANQASETERVEAGDPGPRAWRSPALLALVLLGAGAGLLWAAGRMAPPPAPPEVVPPSTPVVVAPASGPAASSRPATVAATAAAAAPTAAAAPAAAAQAPAAPAPAAPAAAAPATPTAGSPAAAPAAAAPAVAAPAAPAPTPGAQTPIIAVKGGAVTCFEPQSDGDKPVGQPCTNQQLRGRLLDHKAEIESCLAAVPSASRPARGTIALRGRWSLGDPPAGGKLVRVRALKDAPKNPAFLGCVRAELAKLHVKPGVCPRCYAEMTVTITY